MKKIKVLSCCTPEYQDYSPSRDSDSEAASPVPFLCTQDGTEGETDVVWNYYTPKSEHTTISRIKNSTPLSTKEKKQIKPKRIQRALPKRRAVKASQKKNELLQELQELNQNLNNLIEKTARNAVSKEKNQSGSEDDIFNESQEYSPKSGLKTNSHCLRKNLLSSKFSKAEPETALESDDSMNECLLKASQAVEENISKYEPTTSKRVCETPKNNNRKSTFNVEINNDSMDAILNSIKLDSPFVSKVKKCESPCLNNDSFDNLVGNLNDSVLDMLTEIPVKSDLAGKKQTDKSNEDTNWTVAETTVYERSLYSKTFLNRHSSMPESPSLAEMNKPSTSGMAFGRYNTMPYRNEEKRSDSPIKCTPEEIKRKHQQAKEKLIAKRQLPFTSQLSTQSMIATPLDPATSKKPKFQLRVANSDRAEILSTAEIFATMSSNNVQTKPKVNNVSINSIGQKLLIEKKRQEALMKLRRRQPHSHKTV